MKKLVTLFALISASLMVFSCNDTHNPVAANPLADLQKDAAAHMAGGPDESKNAGATLAAGDTLEAHHRNVIALTDYQGQKGGVVHMVIEEEGHAAKRTSGDHGEKVDVLVAFSKDITWNIQHDGADVEIEGSGTTDALTKWALFEAEHDKLYSLILGPTAETTVNVVVTPGGEHGHDH